MNQTTLKHFVGKICNHVPLKTKLVYVLLDGVGDLPNPSLNELTPLQAARTPNLDKLVLNGCMGLVYTVGKGIAPESDAGVLSMLGYDISAGYVGRGPIEAIGESMEFGDGQLALRANFATIDHRGKILDRRAGRNLSSEEAYSLAQAINSGVVLGGGASFQLKATLGHRCVLVIRLKGSNLSSEITNTDPAYIRRGGLGVAVGGTTMSMEVAKAVPTGPARGAIIAATLVNEFTQQSSEILVRHSVNTNRKREGKKPANVILLRDPGHLKPSFEPIDKKYGARFACLADMPVEKGVASVTGMELVKGGTPTDYRLKAELANRLLSRFSVIYVHIKGPDEPGHDGDANLKKEIIEDVDNGFFGELMGHISSEEVVVAVSADHSTPCTLRAHSDHPVPLLLSGNHVNRDKSCRFTERDGTIGSLGVLRGPDVLRTILKLAL